MPKGPITKVFFFFFFYSTITEYSYKFHNIKRRVFIIRTLIIIVLKRKLNEIPKFIGFNYGNFIKDLFNEFDKINSGDNIVDASHNDKNIKNNSSLDNSSDKEERENSLDEKNNIITEFTNKEILNIEEDDISLSFDNKNINDNNEILLILLDEKK